MLSGSSLGALRELVAVVGMDNLFSGDEVLHYLGEGGWKGTMTCRHDCLPKSVPKKYFNFIKSAPVNARSIVAWFEKPIVAVKHVKHQDSDTVNEKKDYNLWHVSFQSTGGTNISMVNALSLVDLYVQDRSNNIFVVLYMIHYFSALFCAISNYLSSLLW